MGGTHGHLRCIRVALNRSGRGGRGWEGVRGGGRGEGVGRPGLDRDGPSLNVAARK